MAKRKTPKGDKIVDLKPKAEKITAEQLSTMQSIVRAINNSQNEIGVFETRKHHLLHQVLELQSHLGELQKTLEEQYGKCDISIVDGTISQKENEQANS